MLHRANDYRDDRFGRCHTRANAETWKNEHIINDISKTNQQLLKLSQLVLNSHISPQFHVLGIIYKMQQYS